MPDRLPFYFIVDAPRPSITMPPNASRSLANPFALPSAPPPPIVVLLDETELRIPPQPSLLAFEDLCLSLPQNPAPTVRFHPYREAATPHPPPAGRGSSPASDQGSELSALTSPPASNRSSPAPQADETRGAANPTPAASNKIRIKRPKSASRINLFNALGWSEVMFNVIRASPSCKLLARLSLPLHA